MVGNDNEELRNILEKMARKHVSIPWKTLPDESPIKEFVRSYNSYNQTTKDGEDWAECILTALTNAKKFDDLKFLERKFTTQDWFLCSQLLKSGFIVRPELLGKLLEKILEEIHQAKVHVPILGTKKPKRGRPTDDTARRFYLSRLMCEVLRLKEKGMSANKAYELIGNREHKAADTVRRDYERHMADRERRLKEMKLKRSKYGGGEMK